MQPITEQDAGCWIDGHWGHYASAKLILIASAYGWEDPAVAAAEVYMDDYTGGDDDLAEEVYDASEDALTYMNTLAPHNFQFGWFDGELFLWSDEDWDEL